MLTFHIVSAVNMQDSQKDHTVLCLLDAALAISLIVIAFLIYSIKKLVTSPFQSGETSLQIWTCLLYRTKYEKWNVQSLWRLDSIESICYKRDSEPKHIPRWSPDTGGGEEGAQEPVKIAIQRTIPGVRGWDDRWLKGRRRDALYSWNDNWQPQRREKI